MEVPFTSEEQNAVIAPEGHHNPGGLVEGNHFGIVETTRIPNSNLPVAHLAKTRGSERILLSHPDNTGALDATVAFGNAHGISASARVEQTDFSVSASCDQDVPDGVKRETLDRVAMPTEDGLW